MVWYDTGVWWVCLIVRNGLHHSSCFEVAVQAVENLVTAVGHSTIWLSGHSLGEAMALLAGKNMAKKGIFLETFLFNPFDVLSAWLPRLYVNPGDHICSEYIGYFEHRRNMSYMGKETEEPLHLIPSAKVIANLSPSNDFKEAHRIKQILIYRSQTP